MKRATLALVVLLAGCGGGSSPNVPTIEPARSYEIAGFQPSGPAPAKTPVEVSFTIQQPDGSTLTAFKRGPGPHTGVHLIYVRKDLSTIIHHHPPLGGSGTIADVVTFPHPGPYRLVIDVYPATCPSPGACNYQLTQKITVAGAYDAPPPAAPRGGALGRAAPAGARERADGRRLPLRALGCDRHLGARAEARARDRHRPGR